MPPTPPTPTLSLSVAKNYLFDDGRRCVRGRPVELEVVAACLLRSRLPQMNRVCVLTSVRAPPRQRGREDGFLTTAVRPMPSTEPNWCMTSLLFSRRGDFFFMTPNESWLRRAPLAPCSWLKSAVAHISEYFFCRSFRIQVRARRRAPWSRASQLAAAAAAPKPFHRSETSRRRNKNGEVASRCPPCNFRSWQERGRAADPVPSRGLDPPPPSLPSPSVT